MLDRYYPACLLLPFISIRRQADQITCVETEKSKCLARVFRRVETEWNVCYKVHQVGVTGGS